jgi:acyl-homoserine lactone synthase
MQVHVVDHTNFFNYAFELDQFFQARHRVYAEELKWVPCAPNGREIDQFDTVDATYLLVIEKGQVIAGSRMIPTDRPHLVAEVFPDAFNLGPIVRSKQVVEWTRGFVLPEFREGAGLLIKAKCCAAVMEYCLSNGYRQVGGIQDAKWLAIWKRMGWAVHKHGKPVDIGGDLWLPAYFDVTMEALESARRFGRLQGAILVDNRLMRAA